MNTVNILGVPVAAINLDQAADRIEEWIRAGRQEYVIVRDVHGIVRAQDDPDLMTIHHRAGMCTPDGMPTVLLGRLYGHKGMTRVYGPDLMLEIMRRSVERGYTHFFYGGKPGVPELLRDRLVARFPGLRVVGVFSPPFRPMTPDEERVLADLIERASPDIIWVGLSTPKQEKWMAAHVGRLKAKVLIGVGAAFDFHAGVQRQAPRWMQRICLEWLYRLWREPRRLWRRYLFGNPRFIWLIAGQLLRDKFLRSAARRRA